MNKKCIQCHQLKPIIQFSVIKRKVKNKQHKGKNYWPNNKCKKCISLLATKWIKLHPEAKIRADKKYKNKIWDKLFGHYGNFCACCGEKNKMFLTLDHINSDGYKERGINGRRLSGTETHRKAIKLNFPKIYQILCYNCNCGRARNKGVCPHTK